MTKQRIVTIALALVFLFCAMSFAVSAASTADAVEPILPETSCSLTVSYVSGETAFSGATVNLYRVAAVSADFQYALTPNYASSGLSLNGIRSAGEWNVVRSTLEAYILANGIAPDAVSETNPTGEVSFASLETGLYFAVVGTVEEEGKLCRFDSALISLPGLGTDGRWQYQVTVQAKGELLPPVEPEKTVEYKVLMLWRGDEGRNDRPTTAEVEIFRNGVLFETVSLSEENHWSYHWTAKDDGSEWSVMEKTVPTEYTVTVDQRGNTFVLTNARTDTDPSNPVHPPQTGDSSNPLLYVFSAVICGAAMILLGLPKKKKEE